MSDQLIIIFSFILMFIGIIGTFIPVLPGLILSFAGLLLYKFGTVNDLPIAYIWVFGTLTLLSSILEYIIPAKFTKKYGGTRWGSVGSVIGMILGFFFIPLLFGFLIGLLLGAFLGELIHDSKNIKKATNAAKGAFMGFIMGTSFNLMIGLAMFLISIYNLVF